MTPALQRGIGVAIPLPPELTISPTAGAVGQTLVVTLNVTAYGCGVIVTFQLGNGVNYTHLPQNGTTDQLNCTHPPGATLIVLDWWYQVPGDYPVSATIHGFNISSNVVSVQISDDPTPAARYAGDWFWGVCAGIAIAVGTTLLLRRFSRSPPSIPTREV